MICEHWTLNTEHSCLLSPVSCLLSHSWRLVSVGEGRGYASLPHTTHSAQLDRRLGSLFSRLPDNPDMRLFSWQVADCCFHHGPRVTATDSWTMGPAATKQNSRPEENWGDYCPTLSYTCFWKILKYCVARKNLFFNFLFLKVWEPGEVRYLLEIWIDQLNHLPGLNRCWFFLAFLVVLRPPWLITWPPGVPANSSVRLQTEFQCSMQEFSWLNFVSQTYLCCVGEIYWREREECGQDLQWNVLISSHWSRASRRAE